MSRSFERTTGAQWAFAVPHRPATITPAAAARELDISRRGIEHLIRSELATELGAASPTAFNDNTDDNDPDTARIVITRAGLDALAAVPNAQPAIPTVNVRVHAARNVTDPDRNYMGWHTGLSPLERDLAVTRWWPRPRIDTTNWAFIATIAGFVVHYGRITGTTIERGQCSYDVDTTDTDVANLYRNTRVVTPPGGLVAYLGA